MSANRRHFLQQTLGLALTAQASSALAANQPESGDGGKPWLEAGDLVAKMNWYNPPASVSYGSGVVTARARPRTDFWRKTRYGYITDNGHFYYIPVFGEFTFRARVDGQYATLYDQAGLMVRLDEKHWMKCGTEFVDGKRRASVVFTHEFSDWSTLDDVAQSGPVYWRVVRQKDSIEAQVSKDGLAWFTVRQGYFQPFVEVRVGIMCAAPEGAGFEAVFDELRLDKP